MFSALDYSTTWRLAPHIRDCVKKLPDRFFVICVSRLVLVRWISLEAPLVVPMGGDPEGSVTSDVV